MSPVTNWRIKPGSLDYPLVIAHRGDHSSVPENTIAAFRQAYETGADGIELDVHLSKDREVVVIHDRFLDRTTTGKGPVRAHTLEELRSLALLGPSGEPIDSHQIPTLDEVFQALPSDYLVCVEMKARIMGMWELPARAEEIIRRYRRWESSLVASFNPVSLFRIRMLDPRITIALNWSRRHGYPLRRRWLSPLANPYWLDPADGTFNQEVLAHFHAQGKPVLAWDIDAGTDMEKLGQMRLDAVVTDELAVLLGRKIR